VTQIEDDAARVLAALIAAQNEGLLAGGVRQYAYIEAVRLAGEAELSNDRVEHAVNLKGSEIAIRCSPGGGVGASVAVVP
jgi:hypothetical protein